MLSRPSEKRVVAGALPAAKACVPRRNRMLSLPEEHAFAASMSKQRNWSLEGRESMAPGDLPTATHGDPRLPTATYTLRLVKDVKSAIAPAPTPTHSNSNRQQAAR